MNCTSAREALSARLDGEPSGRDEVALEAHLASCADCRIWEQSAAGLTRRARLRTVPPADDLTAAVVDRARRGVDRRASWPVERWLLLVVGLVMLAFAMTMLVPGRGDDGHLLREAGVSDLALAVGVLFAALQPWRAAGMLPVVLVLAAGLSVTSAADVLSGRVQPIEESVHTLAPTAALLLWRLRRRGPVWRLSPPAEGLRVVEDERDTA